MVSSLGIRAKDTYRHISISTYINGHIQKHPFATYQGNPIGSLSRARAGMCSGAKRGSFLSQRCFCVCVLCVCYLFLSRKSFFCFCVLCVCHLFLYHRVFFVFLYFVFFTCFCITDIFVCVLCVCHLKTILLSRYAPGAARNQERKIGRVKDDFMFLSLILFCLHVILIRFQTCCEKVVL